LQAFFEKFFNFLQKSCELGINKRFEKYFYDDFAGKRRGKLAF